MDNMPNTGRDWAGLHLSLHRFWEGDPIGVCGRFKGTVLTVWHIKEGAVTVEKGNCVGHANKGEWIVCHPGERHQKFTDNARLLSLHLHIECPTGAARWTGQSVVVFKEDARLKQCLAKLRRCTVVKQLSGEGRLNPEGEASTLESILELKEKLTAFFHQLVMLLKPLGMCYEVSPIRDERVRGTRHRLATGSLREGFSREELARRVALSPSQLDRLWMQELGETPRHYWNWRRLENACELFLSGATGKEVAYETGFDHLSQFSLWFRTNMGESPRQFQARHQGRV